MAGKGPPRTPTRMLRLRKSTWGLDRTDDVAIPSENPEILADLHKLAKAEWERLCVDLAGVGVLTRADRMALTALCYTFARACIAEQQLGDEPANYTVIDLKTGRASASPWVKVAMDSWDAVRRLTAEFGLTPASRSRVIAAPKKGGDSPAAAFFAKKA